MVWSIFSYIYLPLYIFFGEVSIQVFCPFLKWVCFLIVEFSSSWYILEMSPLSVVSPGYIFSQSVFCFLFLSSFCSLNVVTRWFLITLWLVFHSLDRAAMKPLTIHVVWSEQGSPLSFQHVVHSSLTQAAGSLPPMRSGGPWLWAGPTVLKPSLRDRYMQLLHFNLIIHWDPLQMDWSKTTSVYDEEFNYRARTLVKSHSPWGCVKGYI